MWQLHPQASRSKHHLLKMKRARLRSLNGMLAPDPLENRFQNLFLAECFSPRSGARSWNTIWVEPCPCVPGCHQLQATTNNPLGHELPSSCQAGCIDHIQLSLLYCLTSFFLRCCQQFLSQWLLCWLCTTNLVQIPAAPVRNLRCSIFPSLLGNEN